VLQHVAKDRPHRAARDPQESAHLTTRRRRWDADLIRLAAKQGGTPAANGQEERSRVPYTIAYDESRGGVISTFSGSITAEDILNSFIERFEDTQRSTAVTYSIGDYTNVSSLTLSSSNVRDLADRARDLLRRQKHLIVAIVAPSDIAFGLGRMVELYADQAEAITVFRTLAEANAWIAERLPVRHPER
jgi:hypothetical protein